MRFLSHQSPVRIKSELESCQKTPTEKEQQKKTTMETYSRQTQSGRDKTKWKRLTKKI